MKDQILANRNEISQGPAPQCLEAARAIDLCDLASYQPGYFGSLLRPELAKKFNLPEDQIAISYGDEGFLRTIFDQLKEGERVLINELHFGYYDHYLKAKGIEQHEFSLKKSAKEFSFDLEDCINKCGDLKPRLLLITSPNNPTGNSLTQQELEHLMANLNSDRLVAIDEAYYGFDPNYSDENIIKILKKFPDLVLIRTFSKYYALAGLRLGFALMGANVKTMLKYEHPYLGVSAILEKISLAALNNPEYYRNLSAQIIQDRENFIRRVNSLKNFKAYQSKANFVAIEVGEKVKNALKHVLEEEPVLISKSIRENLLRISIGEPIQVKRFVDLITNLDSQ